jgi:hypothetical protein
MTLALTTLATLAFNQWTQSCTSGVTFLVSTTALIIVMLTLGGVSFFILRIAQRPSGLAMLFDRDGVYGRRWGTLYNTLHEGSLYFIFPLLIVVLARSAITGFGQGHGMAQVFALIALDIIVCVGKSLFLRLKYPLKSVLGLVKWKPYYSRGYNRVNYMLDFTKAFSHILMILFVESSHISVGFTFAPIHLPPSADFVFVEN